MHPADPASAGGPPPYSGGVIHSPRPADGPLPGDLYLDPAVPEGERMTMTRAGWSAQVTHVWTGTGWSRLLPGPVRDVPAPPATAPAPPVRVSSSEGLSRWRQRKQDREAAGARGGRRRP